MSTCIDGFPLIKKKNRREIKASSFYLNLCCTFLNRKSVLRQQPILSPIPSVLAKQKRIQIPHDPTGVTRNDLVILCCVSVLELLALHPYHQRNSTAIILSSLMFKFYQIQIPRKRSKTRYEGSTAVLNMQYATNEQKHWDSYQRTTYIVFQDYEHLLLGQL